MNRQDPTAEFRRFVTRGDADALGAVFDATAAELLGVAHHLVRDLDVAEDLVQSTFLTAIENRDRFDRSTRITPWLIGILTNLARRHRETCARRPDPRRLTRLRESALEAAPEPAPESAAADHELSEAVTAAIRALPEAYRPVLMLHLRHGLPPHEIALDLGRAPATVRKQLQRGLERLRRVLPAGIAGLCLAGALPARGLAAMRTTVLSHAAAVPPVVLSVTGVLVMKKILAAVAAVLALATAWATYPWTEAVEPVPANVGSGPPSKAKAKATSVADVAQRTAIAPAPSPPAQRATPIEKASATITVRGVVRGIGNRPVANAAVFLTKQQEGNHGAIAATTDSRGRFELFDVELDGFVSAFGKGYMPCDARLIAGDPGGSQDVELTLEEPGRPLRGRVLLPDGRPAAAARILIGRTFRDRGRNRPTRLGRPPLWLRTGPDGRFATDSAPDWSPFYVMHPDAAPWFGELPERRDAGVEVQLQAGGTLVGKVRGQDGEPLAGVWVGTGIRSAGEPVWFARGATTDEAGEFRVTHVPATTLEIGVRKRGFHTLEHRIDVVDQAEVGFYPTLRPTASIRGVVRDASGDGLADYQVAAHEMVHGRSRRSLSPVRTAADGSFVLTDCQGDSYRVRVYAPKDEGGFVLHQVSDVPPGAGRIEIQIRAEQIDLGSVRGTLVYADGTPARRAHFSIRRKPFDSGRELLSDMQTGAVRIEAMPADSYKLVVRAPNHPKVEHAFAIARGQHLDLGAIRLPDPAFLELTVRHTDGSPAEGYVGLLDARNEPAGIIYIGNGRGRSEPLVPGSYVVRGYDLRTPEERCKVKLGPGATQRLALELALNNDRTFAFDVPTPKDLTLHVRILHDDGTECIEYTGLALPRRRTQEFTEPFLAGSYRVVVKEVDGELRGTTKFQVVDGEGAGRVVVRLR